MKNIICILAAIVTMVVGVGAYKFIYEVITNSDMPGWIQFLILASSGGGLICCWNKLVEE